MTELPARRLLLVHAHPDDESINNGVTMARYAAEGARVTLVTCTLGERGEVIPPGLAHLSGPALGGHRRGELAEAMRALGVADARLLGGPGRYADSGMMGLPDNDDAGCLWQADVDEAAGLLLDVIREVRPQVLVTYDPDGGYGHPDHIQAHRIAMRAVELADEAGCPVAKVYWNRVPRGVAEDAFARLREELPALPFDRAADVRDVPGVVDDGRITTVIRGEGTPHAAAKAAAMRAHATQITVAGPYFVLSNDLAQPILTTEYYELVRGGRTGGRDGAARESDLFEGIAADAGTGPAPDGGRPGGPGGPAPDGGPGTPSPRGAAS
ncbi:N-acetyl-1-D-myo-inositol-2-amino-2-deoxy-alpha-D-glucopyranoside deacetylase [Streptomyces sp. SID8352]|uniref:N-acetyl-1-D-myo-inositol-2-amino-2-deoxy-alpha- D-glucopyranoside deacetylase n=1 Tax=Streptomyces sp. SID8352 TaxID=2690338 RepID=UPI00136DA2B2|nr:N-acetyl-1-D-myo-inositol-2-amino-2-deoxy-alpha-D-glucopyranoside deacetylase [Streptomyces sp. SID8352]MYU23573.1 N-acetyl-1-D-myo-inositol-2-amino-2-deoxy-alpha-D-glucopyranoside deacetylase [Streptomyces sp. SID8352]